MDRLDERHCPGEEFLQEARRLGESRKALLAFLDSLASIGKSRNFVNSDEYRGDICGVPVFVKTFSRRQFFIRLFYGRHCIRNEFRANAVINERGLARVATPYCLIGKETAAFQFIPNSGPLENPRHHGDFVVPGKEFFQELIEYVRALHSNGICHGDLRRANIIVGNDGHPWLVDTASAIVLPKHPGILGKYLFRCMEKSDMFSLAKIVFSYYPDWQDEELKQAYERQPFFLKAARYARHYLYALLRHKRRKTLKVK